VIDRLKQIENTDSLNAQWVQVKLFMADLNLLELCIFMASMSFWCIFLRLAKSVVKVAYFWSPCSSALTFMKMLGAKHFLNVREATSISNLHSRSLNYVMLLKSAA
jgi:hypothetical protein